MDTPNTIKDRENEKFKEFLRLLKTNPEIIENQAIKNEYKNLLEIAMDRAKVNGYWSETVVPELLNLNIIDKSDKEWYKELLDIAMKEAKSNIDWAKYIIPKLLKLNIIDKSEIKKQYKELLEVAIEKAKSGNDWAGDVLPILLNLNIIDKSDKEWYKELLDVAIDKIKSSYYWAEDIVPELLKLNIIDKSEIKKQYKELLNVAMEEAKSGNDWTKEVLPVLLNLNIIDKSEIKEQYKELLNIAMEKSKSSYYWAGYIVPELLKLNIIDKSEIKEQYKELLEVAIEKAKLDGDWAETVVPKLLNINIIDKSDKKWYKKLLNVAMKEAKWNNDWAGYVVPKLLKLNIIDKSEIKEQYKELLEVAIEKAKLDGDWAEIVVPELLNINIIDKSDKKWYKKLLNVAIEEAKSDIDLARFIVPELLKLNIIDKSEIKKPYNELLNVAIEIAKWNNDWAKDVLPELLNLNIIDKSDKEWYKELLNIAIEEAKSSYYWAVYIVPELLNLNIINKSDKEWYKELLDVAIEEAKSDIYWAEYIVPELLKLNIIDKSNKEWYKELLDVAIEIAKTNKLWAKYIVPELLKLNIIDKSEINIDIDLIQHITLNWTTFLENNRDKINAKDIEFINQIDGCFSKEEINYLYKQNYEYFEKIEIAVKEKDYQNIWEIKKEFYSREEKEKIEELEKHFWKWIWTYFVDKVPWNKTIKNRFRDPHNALLRDIIHFYYTYLAKNWVTKKDFLKNYLWVAWDRNNWYQQLNNFIEKCKTNWKELVEWAKDIDEFKGNTEFKYLAEWILEQERTGELYKNLDNLEQILTLLHMIRNKESLIKLWKLANSDNPDDKKLYEYYKWAIYHPRTKPIIMKMYEKPWEFLGLDDTTFSALNTIHQAKKPSNMVENFEFLDFDAKDLVNCLPLWVYDKLSYFKPFEMKFYISGSDVFTKDEIQQKISEFLSWADQKKITNIIKKLKENGDELMWYQIRKNNKETFIDELMTKYTPTDLINLFTELWYSEFNKYRNLKLMTAKISPKSDPNNWFNGFNCDSLSEWHGKKVVAMFNPYCTDFCIYEWDQDPKEDNLKVTSWVTLNRAIPENFTTLLNKVKSETTHDIANVLWDKFKDYKDPSEYVITMDNIEANPNFGRKNELTVRKMYEKFFSEYVKKNPISPNWIPINTNKFYSWVNYNKLDILTYRVPNESLPVFVNAYSDNSESYSLQWNIDAWEQKEKEKKIWIHPLSIEDVVQISYMEWKIYPSSMKDHLWNLQHEITASILNNTLKWRPNLSFARYNEEWKIWWYILAYQWKMEDWTPWVYISDFAMDEKERWTAWIKMIHHWMKEVKEKYPNMPVFTRARENTSYRMIKAFAEKQWYEIVKDEIMEDWWENFHWVIMNPKK